MPRSSIEEGRARKIEAAKAAVATINTRLASFNSRWGTNYVATLDVTEGFGTYGVVAFARVSDNGRPVHVPKTMIEFIDALSKFGHYVETKGVSNDLPE